mmetsp:Transcript_45578/g.72926  ORF Transcript_45578/g.72926 Transcript_45578/m.72926 type:complete len:206 (-) Transcript_45578:811-1428(-)
MTNNYHCTPSTRICSSVAFSYCCFNDHNRSRCCCLLIPYNDFKSSLRLIASHKMPNVKTPYFANLSYRNALMPHSFLNRSISLFIFWHLAKNFFRSILLLIPISFSRNSSSKCSIISKSQHSVSSNLLAYFFMLVPARNRKKFCFMLSSADILRTAPSSSLWSSASALCRIVSATLTWSCTESLTPDPSAVIGSFPFCGVPTSST